MSNSIKAIGLFGTCGSSTWRAPFIEAFEAETNRMRVMGALAEGKSPPPG